MGSFVSWEEMKILIIILTWFFALILPILLILSRRYISYLFCMIFIIFFSIFLYYYPNDLRVLFVILIFAKTLYLAIYWVVSDIKLKIYQKDELLVSFIIISLVFFIEYVYFLRNSYDWNQFLARILPVPFGNIRIDFVITIVILVYVYIRDKQDKRFIK